MKKKTKILIIVLLIVAVVAIVVGITLGILLKKPDKPKNGSIYQTSSKSFWSGTGSAYLSFDYLEEPENKTADDTKLYGYVFNVMVSYPGSDGYESWLTGTWDLQETNGTYGVLTLTATWGEGKTSLVEAVSGQPKTYSNVDGKYTIKVHVDSADDFDFTLDPVKDKVGDTPTPTTPCTEHVDENKDGKCDKCGEDMPTPSEAAVQATLSAENSTIKSKIELKNDNTWTLSMCYYGDAYTPSADGRWSMNTTTYGITLVVENDTANMLAQDSYDLAINYETQKYSATITITMPSNVPTIGGTALDFAFAQEAEKPPVKEVEKTLNADNGTQKAKIELYKDKTWEVSINFYGGNYSPMASGTWEVDTTMYNIALTVTTDEANVLAEETYTLNVDYTTYDYSTSMTLNVPQVGELTFNFNSAVVTETHYTVTYDLNYANAPAGGTAETKTFKIDDVSKEYLEAAPATPTRDGYKFAGWYTVANPTLTNGVSDKEYLFGTKLETTYNAPPAHLTNAVMEITENTTLYARWVEVKEISTAAQLKDMAKDLTGWYKLTADINLTEEWTPVGLYYANYEFYQPAWWLYSFRGTLDGNGHKISGLRLTTLDFEDNAVAATAGSADGTTALFASVVNATVKNLTIDGASITITNYEANTHAYVSVLAAFVQGSNTLFENCTVKNATVTVSTKNIWYVAVGGLFAGHWGGNAKNCDVLDSTISVTTVTDKILTGYTYETNYIGGLVGEGYAWMKNCDAKNVNVTYTLTDNRTTIGQYDTTDYMGQPTKADVPVNVYLGGAMASSTYLQGVTYNGNVTFNYTKAVGAASVNLGGLSGLQRYGYIQNSLAKANMTIANNNSAVVAGQTFAVGGILGGFDATMGLVGAMFGITGDRITNCIDISTMTATGTSVLTDELKAVGSIPADAVVSAMAPAMGVDLTSFKRADDSLNYFGIFDSVIVRTTATAADVDGNVTVAAESSLHGDALETTLGEGWNYTTNELPTPKTVA